MTKTRTTAGFSLLELMIVVGIVAILASLAIAGYDYAMRKTRRAAAQGCLTEGAQRAERFYTTHMTYTGAPAPTCSTDVSKYYAVRFAAGEPTNTTYLLEAVPQGPQRKDSCGTLTLNDRTQKTPATDCW